MTNGFNERFRRFTPSAEEQKTIDKITSFSLKIDKENRIIYCDADFGAPAGFDELFSLAEGIREAYRIAKFRFFPHFDSSYFGSDYFPELVRYLNTYCDTSIGNGYFIKYNAVYDSENHRMNVKLTDGLEPSLLYASGVHTFLKEATKSQFGIDVDYAFTADFAGMILETDRAREFNAKAREDYKRMQKEREESQKNALSADDGEKSASFAPLDGEDFSRDGDIVKSGRLTFDISDPKFICGTEHKHKLIPVSEIAPEKRVTFCGKLFSVEEKENRDGDKINYRLYVTDLEASVMVRYTAPSDAPVKFKAPAFIMVSGIASIDKFDGELVVRASAVSKIKRIIVQDNSPEKRVELHLHTNMSANDALCEPYEVMQRAHDWGMDAIAFTDHGNAQSYPEVMKAQKDFPDVKPIFGMEGYVVDDTSKATFGAVSGTLSFADDEFIVFDIETTGLSPATCGITEIGAVRYKSGEVLEEFDTFVNPGMPIPANITQLTGISDDMVKDAPSEAEAVKQFLDFTGGKILVAHNASFDTSFIRKVAQQNGIPFTNPYLDTLALSKYLNSELSKHNLDAVRKYYGLGEFNHHRACDDCRMLSEIFRCMIQKMEPDGVHTLDDLEKEMSQHSDPKKQRPYHISILVKNPVGLKNLYKLISYSYLNYYARFPRIPKTVLTQHRDGLIIGSACSAGELYSAILDSRPNADLYKIADFYDYFEIMPDCNNGYLLDEGRVESNEALRRINERIIAIAEKQNKPYVATGDVHFLDKDDEIYRQILLHALKFGDADRTTGLYFRNTDMMLEEFAYLGPEKAYKAVVTNTRLISDMVEAGIKPIPDGTYTPEIEGAEEELMQCCYDKAHEMYGDPLPDVVAERAKKELDSVISHGYAVLYIIARKLVQNSEAHGYLVGSRGSVGSSFIATLCGVSEVNPLPPHYRCPKCKKSIFFLDGSVGSGFDMPDRYCECGEKMINDGHDIPFETFLGFHGDKAPDIDLNFSGHNQSDAHKYTEVLFGKENIFRAGTVGTIASKTAYGYVMKYLDEYNEKHPDAKINLSKAEINRLTCGCVGIKRTTGQHPGGIVVIPKKYEIYDFTPVQHPADKESSGVVTTHFAFEYLHDTLLKLDILGHDVPTIYRMLEDYTGIDVRTVPMNDTKVYSLFTSPDALGANADAVGCDTGTLALPEMGTSYVRQMMMTARPKNFSDLLQISGLSHGTGIWLNNGETLIKEGICTIDTIIGTRDSIMLYLLHRGLPPTYAFKIMESVRKGKGLTQEFEDVMREHEVPEWYIASCKKIKYMFPKAHAAAYVIAALRLAWYKVHRPVEFYAAYFSAKPDGFESQTVMRPKKAIEADLARMSAPGTELTQKDEDTYNVLQIVNEMYARGIQFLPIDVYRSTAFTFVPEDGKIRLPLISLAGLGETAADNIYKAVSSGEATTLEELKTVASLSKTVVDTLVQNGCLGSMPESNQMTLF